MPTPSHAFVHWPDRSAARRCVLTGPMVPARTHCPTGIIRRRWRRGSSSCHGRLWRSASRSRCSICAQRNQDYRSSGLAELSGSRATWASPPYWPLLAMGLASSCPSPPVPPARACIFGSVASGGSYTNSWRAAFAPTSQQAQRMAPLFPAVRLAGRLAHAGDGNRCRAPAVPQPCVRQRSARTICAGDVTIFLPASLLGAAVGQVHYQRAAADWAAGRTIHGLWKSTPDKLCRYGLPTYPG